MPDRDRRNVVLTGFMGTGKTTVGRLLADRIGFGFVDTDAVIVERHGTIAAIFAEHGEAEFRRIEAAMAVELAQRSGLVISTGGRMLVDPVNAGVLEATGRVFCLTAGVDTIIERVAPDGIARDRPMLHGHADIRARVAALLAERAPAYAGFEQVATDARTPEQVCEALVDLLTP